jgi:type VI secretion system protein ImpH
VSADAANTATVTTAATSVVPARSSVVAEAPAPAAPGRLRMPTVEERLFAEPFAFDFFQAVRLLERLEPTRVAVGRGGPPKAEVVRFRAHVALSFPASQIYELERPEGSSLALPVMVVTFLGLHGPSGILPRHYTEILMKLAKDKENRGPERFALRDWFDLFNHRFISLFFRAWEKYRFYIPYERKEYDNPEPDPFTLCLRSFIGLGQSAQRRRLRVALWDQTDDTQPERVLAHVEDLAVLHFAGFLGHRPRNAVSLQALLADYFELPIQVQQFRGQWLLLDPANQSALVDGGNTQMGVNLVAGERTWDVRSKVRIRLGPLSYFQFLQFLPDRSPERSRKAFYLLGHLVRLYVGPELDYDVQVVLRAEDVPPLHLTDSPTLGPGPRLGWNTWICSGPLDRDAADAAFEGEEVFWLNQDERIRSLEQVM